MHSAEPLAGFATTDGTAHYRDRFSEAKGVRFFRDEQRLSISSIGIGTYLGQADETTDRLYASSISQAVEGGINLIDTAANYRFQRSERSIGAALDELIGSGKYQRAELLICTKGGYLPYDGVPPATAEAAREYVAQTFVRPGLIHFSDLVGGSHCLAPTYLQNQIDQSLRNMNLATIDVYYLHNPEAQLAEVSRAEFEKRLYAAFELLEQNVAAGKIKMYGVATWNGLRVPPEAREHLALGRLVKLAREAGGNSHKFRFVQLPVNLAMPEALTLRNQSLEVDAPLSLLEAARAAGVTVVASASLLQGRAARALPPKIRQALGNLRTDAQTAIQFVRSTPGVTTALVGMSRPEHVAENLQLAAVAPATPDEYRQLFG